MYTVNFWLLELVTEISNSKLPNATLSTINSKFNQPHEMFQVEIEMSQGR